MIDALPETHGAAAFARRGFRVHLAYYSHGVAEHDWRDGRDYDPVHCNRVWAMDGTMARFRAGAAELPAEARVLGGRVRDGVGEYYRELLAPQRTLEQDAQGNWVARWLDHAKADHFAHAEVYCREAQWIGTRAGARCRWVE